MRRLCHPLLFPLSLLCFGCLSATVASAQDARTVIGTVQGKGARSPLTGQDIVVEGMVTAIVDGGSGGWFVQDDGDGDMSTSDALFVAAGDAPSPAIGQRVRVRGTVAELNAGDGTRTALQAASVTPLGKGKVRSVAIAAPPADWERYENMRVRIAAPLTVAGTHRAAKYGELMVNFGERLRTPSDAVAPGEALRALAAENARRTLRLDDGSDAEQPASLWYLPKAGLPRTGGRLSKVEGVIDQRGGGYRLQLTAKPAFRRTPSPAAPKVGGDVRIASFNLENFFNGDGRGGCFPTPRGARTPAEQQTQLARLVATIQALNPDIAALMEVENDGFGPESSIAMLVNALNGGFDANSAVGSVVAMLNAGGGDWRAVATDANQGGDQIRVGLIYRASRVSEAGTAATLTDDLFGTRNRPPLAQTFRAGRGPGFTVVANHLKSKNCGNANGADADQKDGQSCWNATRTESARRLDAWLRTDPTRSGSDLAMIVGDLNAYSMEDPIRLLAAAGWRDAFAGQRGPAPYSYVYDGLTGRLDHALLSPALAARLVGAAEWHSNADEPDSRGYQVRPNDRSPWRSSDHDPLVVGFRLRTP